MTLLNHQMKVAVIEMFSGSKVSEDIVDTGKHTFSATYGAEGKECGHKTTAYQEHYLKNVSPRNRRKSSIYRIDTGDNIKTHYNDHSHGNREVSADKRSSLKTKNLLNGKSSEPCNGSKVHKHIKEEPEDGERKSHTIVVTLTKELRNRENLTLKHHRKQELSDHDKRYSSHKLIRGRRNTISIAGTGHTDKLLGGNVGCNQRRSYSPPSKSVAGEEIVIGTFLLTLFASSK